MLLEPSHRTVLPKASQLLNFCGGSQGSLSCSWKVRRRAGGNPCELNVLILYYDEIEHL